MAKHRKEDVKKTEVKRKKKIWVSILAPKQFNNIEIGETLCEEPKQLLGRNIDVNLMVLTNDPKKQNVFVKLLVNEVKDDKVYTGFVGYSISPSYIRRVSKRAKIKFDESFVCISKDNVNVRIKVLVLFKNRLKSSVASLMRKEIRDYVSEVVKNNEFEKIVNLGLNQGLQKDIKSKINKVYPALSCMVREVSR